jgi:hypothetical protein
MWEKEVSGPKAFQTALLWTIYCVAFLSHSQKTATLITKMKQMMGSLDRDTMARAFRMFLFRIEAVVAADGNFIEYIHFRYILLPSFFYFYKIGSFSAVLCYF